jgi:putative sterol carrier protein
VNGTRLTQPAWLSDGDTNWFGNALLRKELIPLAEKTARQLIEDMPKAFRPERAGRAKAVIQFQLSGEGGGNWTLTIEDRKCTVSEGITPAANATVQMTAADYVALAAGKLSGMKAFMSGRVKASGDISLLQRLDRWFVRG